MSESTKATRAPVQIGSMSVDGFMLPNGSYRMSQTQAAECVGKPEINARRFLSSKALQSLLGENYTPDTFEIESEEGKRGQSRFRGLPLEVVTVYWIYQCYQGNKQALSLVIALATESLERRFDAAFSITHTEQERNERLSQHIQRLEQDLGKAYAQADVERYQREYLESEMRQQGIEPWSLPNEGEP